MTEDDLTPEGEQRPDEAAASPPEDQRPETRTADVEEAAARPDGEDAAARPDGEEAAAPPVVEEAAARPDGEEAAAPPVVEEVAQQPSRDAAEPPAESPAEPTPEADELAVTRMELEERTLDLQRLQAEFLNYKRRVDRDRELIRENATFAVLTPIIDVLDTIDRAREHEPLEGGFKATAEQLERVVAGLGLVKFGEVGDAFDPNVHEALSHIGTDSEVEVTTCKVIAKAGYKIGDRVVRAAQVLVVDPA